MARGTELLRIGAVTRLAVAALTAAACAGCDRDEAEVRPATEVEPGTAPAGPDDVQIAYARPGDRVELNGSVSALNAQGFLFDYGVGTIWVRSPGSVVAGLSEGQTLRVIGRLEKNGAAPELAAEAVTAQNEHNRFCAGATDQPALSDGLPVR